MRVRKEEVTQSLRIFFCFVFQTQPFLLSTSLAPYDVYSTLPLEDRQSFNDFYPYSREKDPYVDILDVDYVQVTSKT